MRWNGSIAGPYESDRIQVQGYVVQNYGEGYSHHASTRSLGEWLRGEGVPAITGIDTRTLTRRLREFGTMQGWLFPASMNLHDAQRSATGVEMRNEAFRSVVPKETTLHRSGDLTILVVDARAKDNIVRSLLERDPRRRMQRLRAHARSRMAEDHRAGRLIPVIILRACRG